MSDCSQEALQGQWEAVYGQLRQELGDKIALRWLKKIVPDRMENNKVTLFVPSPCIHELVKQNYADQILSLWRDRNPAVGGLTFQLHRPELADSSHPVPPEVVPSLPILAESGASDEDMVSLLDPTHTFESFVVGQPNQFAYAAARKVAEDTSVTFNPLYLHSSVGLGKTHLMHAIAWQIKRLSPEKSVLYLSSEQFFHRFIKSLRSNTTDSFRDLFRSVDVLMIDDIQFIIGKKATQEEFFHTFNDLIARGKKIILSSDSSPLDLQGIEDRLKTRIAQGLVVGIHPTSYELRLGILQEKAARMPIAVPENVLDFMAKTITSNVRELEGALKRIVAHAELIGGAVSIETTRTVLRDILNAYDKPVQVPDIQQMTARYFGVSLNDLKSTRRDRRIARPRQIAMYLAKTLTSLSLPDIAAFFGRDHTTVMHAVKTIEGLMTRDTQMKTDIAVLSQKLKEGETHDREYTF